MNEDTSQLKELVTYQGSDRVVHFTDYLIENAGVSKKVKRFTSGFSFFDEKCGLETGEVIVVSGHTKAGKTLFAESWCRAMGLKNPEAKTIIFSFEVQPEKMLVKYMRDDQLPLYVPTSLQTMDFNWLKNRCLEAKLKFGCNIALVDHLHFLVDMATKQNMSLNIGAFMRKLKHEIAIGLNMAVVLIAHQGQPKDDREASLNAIRDSSFVGQESDATIIVSRRENFNNADLKEFLAKYGDERASKVLPPDSQNSDDDNYSAGLSVVKIAVHRRTGIFNAKKLFRKNGNFLDEV